MWKRLFALLTVIISFSVFAEETASAPAAASNAASAASAASNAGIAGGTLDYPYAGWTVLFLYIAVGISLYVAGRKAGKENWSIGKALSDPIKVSSTKANVAPVAAAAAAPAAGGNQNIVSTTTEDVALTPSTSRYVAFVGMVMLIVMFLGFGSIIVWRYAHGGKVGDSSEITKFLLGGAALFLPYGFNQIQKAVSSLGSK